MASRINTAITRTEPWKAEFENLANNECFNATTFASGDAWCTLLVKRKMLPWYGLIRRPTLAWAGGRQASRLQRYRETKQTASVKRGRSGFKDLTGAGPVPPVCPHPDRSNPGSIPFLDSLAAGNHNYLRANHTVYSHESGSDSRAYVTDMPILWDKREKD
jgi:hypothetical protein